MKPILFREETLERLKFHIKSNYPKPTIGLLYGLESEVKEIINVEPIYDGSQLNPESLDEYSDVTNESLGLLSGLQLLGIYMFKNTANINSIKIPGLSYLNTTVVNGELAKMESWYIDERGKARSEKISDYTIQNTTV